MERNRNRVWIVFGVMAAILTAAGTYFLLRNLRKGPSNANIRRVEAIIREAEDLIRHHS